MTWEVGHDNRLTWQEPVTDETIVTVSVGELTAALAEALKVARIVPQPFKIGDKINISATVTGIKQRHVSIVLDGATMLVTSHIRLT